MPFIENAIQAGIDRPRGGGSASALRYPLEVSALRRKFSPGGPAMPARGAAGGHSQMGTGTLDDSRIACRKYHQDTSVASHAAAADNACAERAAGKGSATPQAGMSAEVRNAARRLRRAAPGVIRRLRR